jgi:hypothetical protein
MPRWTYGPDTSGVPVGPAAPTTAPSAIAAPSATTIEPRCVSVTASPSGVVIVTLSPELGTVPANVTVPAAGATTGSPWPAPMSTPRCSPAEYGCAGSKTNGCRTGPLTGHVQARAAGTTKSPRRTASRRTRRIDTTLLSEERTIASG